MKYSAILLAIVASVYAAPSIPDCINPETFETALLSALDKELGKKFVDDFAEAYEKTISISQLGDVPCYDYSNGDFICSTLETIYRARIPESSDTVSRNCQGLLDNLYPNHS